MLLIRRIILLTCLSLLAQKVTAAEFSRLETTLQRLIDEGSPVVKDLYGEEHILAGDVLIPLRARDRSTRASFTGIEWDSAVVYYEFHPSVTAAQQALFLAAAQQWSNASALVFIQNSSVFGRIIVQTAPPNYPGCGGSPIGRQVNDAYQSLIIRGDCWNQRTLVHEIGHAIGLIHEHQNSKREAFVQITNSTDLQTNCPSLFGVNYERPSGDPYVDTPYDFGSVMHYPHVSGFACAGRTMTVTINAIARQPVVAFDPSSNICTTPSACNPVMGTASVSYRDALGAAKRYGYRITYPPGINFIFSTPNFTCGPQCVGFRMHANILIRVPNLNGKVARISGACFGHGQCAITNLDGNKEVSVVWQ
jgi:hypothetical protein